MVTWEKDLKFGGSAFFWSDNRAIMLKLVKDSTEIDLMLSKAGTSDQVIVQVDKDGSPCRTLFIRS